MGHEQIHIFIHTNIYDWPRFATENSVSSGFNTQSSTRLPHIRCESAYVPNRSAVHNRFYSVRFDGYTEYAYY